MAEPAVNAGLETVIGSGRARSARGWPSPAEHAASPAKLSTSSHRMARSLARIRPGRWRGKGVVDVVTAYILVQTEVGKAAQVAKDIIDIPGVQEAQAVTGPYDVIVRAEAQSIDELGQLVVARVQAVNGITRTLTCPVVRL
jgi:DNA-binding Lrp family transcriptional regulator